MTFLSYFSYVLGPALLFTVVGGAFASLLALISPEFVKEWFVTVTFDDAALRYVAAIAGAFMVISGFLQLLSIRRRCGRGPWRGTLVMLVASIGVGFLVIVDSIWKNSIWFPILLCVLAAAVHFGLWLTRRDAAGQTP